MTTITLMALSGRFQAIVPYDPNELVWQFSRRIMVVIGAVGDDPNTNPALCLYQNQQVNNVANRLMRMGDIVRNPTERLLFIPWKMFRDPRDPAFVGNSSPTGAERDICAICWEALTPVVGSANNPLLPIALRCGHAFHKGCVEQQNSCPICRR